MAGTQAAHRGRVSPSADDLAAQFAELDAAAQASGSATRTLLLGGLAVRFEASDVATLDLLCSAMRHLPVVDTAPDASVRIVRRQALAGAVTWRWAWTLPRYDDVRYAFSVMGWMGFLVAEDRIARRTLIVVDDESMDRLDRPETTRPIIETLLGRFDLVCVHGGTVGDDERCVLLAARGGSGKSSLVAQAVHRGYRTVGEDFLYLQPGPDPILYSAYATVKLSPSSPASGLVDQAVPVVDGKRMGWLPDIRPGCMADQQRPLAIVVPSVGERVAIGPADERTILTALLPTSTMMATDRERAAQLLTVLARSLPCFSLTVAGDADAELAALRSVVPGLEPATRSAG